MARVPYKLPTDVADDDVRTWLEGSIERGRPGPEIQSIRAHSPGVMRSFNQTRADLYHDGALDFELKEMLRAYIAATADCTYCSAYGQAAEWKQSQDAMKELAGYWESDQYTRRQKVALRYADAIMWDPALADDELWDALNSEFNPEEVVELGYWVGFTYGGQRWIKTLQARQGELDAAIAAAEVVGVSE